MEVMTVKEVAAYLNLNPQTVYKMARDGHLPSVRIGRALRFVREILDEWLEPKGNSKAHVLAAKAERIRKLEVENHQLRHDLQENEKQFIFKN